MTRVIPRGSAIVGALSALLLITPGCGSPGDELKDGSEELGASESELRHTPSAPRPFDILHFGEVGGIPYMIVRGVAGSLIPEIGSDEIFAYVFVTDAGVFAVASHEIEDSTEVENDLEWHAHRVTLDTNNCITAIEETGDALLFGNMVGVLNSGASSVSAAMTVVLEPTAEGICVTKVWDSLSH